MKLRIIAVVVSAITLLFCNTTQAQNGIEPRYERYNADRKSIEVDGDLSDWSGVNFIEPRFEASNGSETGKGNSTIGDVTYSTFAEYSGGTWSGPEDHTTLTAVAWDQNGLYLGIVVTDDEHEHASGSAWNGDGVQMGLTDADRSTVTHLYNYCIKDGYESGKVYKNGDAGIIADKERGPGNYSVAMVRDDAKKTTTYEALFTPDSFGFAKFEVGQQFGFGVCVNDGDKDTPGQKGWSGWGPHMIVFGKTAPAAALVTLTAAEVLASFETDFSDGEIPETAELFGTATIGPDELDEADEPNEFLHVTDAVNSQNGAMKIQDITDGRTFKEFEVGFRLYISDSTCCGNEDDMSPAHRPADGWSLSIGNDLPDTIGLPEEGTGSGIRICFDTWDSGGGEAPAIDVWNGVEGEVGDGDQDAWSGGLFVRQKFDGVTAAKDEEKFKDPETGEFVFMWTHGEWVDFSLKVFGGRIKINYKGYEMINEELPTGWPALTAPQWLFAGRTGGANAAHWVDDFYVKVFKPSGPIISSFKGAANGFSVSLVDAEGNGLDLDSAKAKFDGADVVVNKSKSDGETTIAYSTDAPLASGSDHTIQLTYTDEKGTVHDKTLSFSVPKYIILNADSIVSDSVKGESGFIANITQISIEQTGKDSLHGNKVANAEKQLNGEYIDPDFEEPWLNEADLDAEEGWSYYPVWVEWVNQNQDAPAPAGNFSSNNGYEDEYIPGIPGWYDSTDGVAGEYIALLELDEGAYTLGVNSDDGFRATIGANYNDILAQEIGVFDGGRGASDSIFDILVTKAGLYPFRVLWFEGVGGANIEIFSLVEGEKVLINDPDVEGAIKAFIPKGATFDEQITERDATTGRAAVVSITPASGEKRVEPNSSIEVAIENGSATSVNQSSVKMSVNGQDVAVDVSRSGDVVTIIHTPDGNLAGETNTAVVSFKESNGVERSAEWSFEVKVTKPAPTLATFLIDFGGTAANSAGASPVPWVSLDNLAVDIAAELGDGVTLTALDDGFSPNNPAQPGEDAEHDGVVVPQEARNDYFFKITDTAGTSARMRIDGLPAGNYNVTVFAGRTTDGGQYAKIWTVEEPEEENTGNFAQGSATVEVSVSAGEPLWYKHLEDNTGGVSGMIIRKTSDPASGGSGSGPISGLIAHFPLDSDGNSSDGNFTASTETDVDFGSEGANANTGTSATFNGSSSLIQHDWSADLNPESFTLALWAKSNGGAGAWNSPVTSRHDLYNQGEASQGYLIYDNNPAGLWTFWSGNGDVAGNWQILDGPEANLGEWDHVAITYDNDEEMKRLYVNGELAVEANDSIFPNDTTPFNIGSGGDNGGTFRFKGDLDDIGLWNRALSQSEIQTVMEQGVSGGGGAAGPAVAYEAPEGGWSYSLDTGDISSWNHDNGSDQWDESAIGGEFGDDNRPGGVSLIDGYVRIQDTGDPRDNYPDPGSNRKIYLGQDISDKGGSDTILDDGATIHFIARIPTDGPLDPLGDEDYPAGGDGYENHDGGKGNIGINQGAGGIISFSLNEEGKVLITEDGTEMELSTTEWHEFWVTIEAGDGGHKVSVYLDGSTEPTEFTVAAGGGSDFDGSYVAMGAGSTGRSGALDVAAFNFAPGAIAPAGAGGGAGDLVDISAAGDAVVPTSDNSPGGEQAANAIDDNDQTKYLNFDGANDNPSGLTITTGGGVVTGLGLTSANDAPDRDPATFVLSGSNDGGATFTEIASGDVPVFGDRFERQEVSFANDAAYTTYELIFPTTAGPSTCCMQIAEIELLGTAAAGALTEPTIVDFGDLSGDASYEFFFNAIKAGASTAIAGNNAFGFKLDQWNEQGVFGTTVFGVADNVFTAVEGKSVASVFDRDVHVVLVNDTAAGETRLYVDGDHVGVLDGNFELAGEAKVMGARIEANTDPMGEGSVMYKWAAYNSALSGAEIADLAAAVGGAGGDAPALSVVSNGDGTVTITFEGKLQSAPTVNGPWEDVDGAASPLTIPADQAQQYGRAVN